MHFALLNVGIIVVFSVIWSWQYHVHPNLSDRIDAIVVPWIWLIAFFVPSYVMLRKLIPMALVVAIVWSGLASGLLWLIVRVALPPFFDPMW